MSRELTTEATIGDHTYTIGLHGPDEGDEIVAYLSKTFGPILAARAVGDDDGADIGTRLSGAMSGVSGKEHAKFMRLLLSVCQVNGKKLDGGAYTAHFTTFATPADRYTLAVQVIQHNRFFELAGIADAFLAP